jgi:hypothetical protein
MPSAWHRALRRNNKRLRQNVAQSHGSKSGHSDHRPGDLTVLRGFFHLKTGDLFAFGVFTGRFLRHVLDELGVFFSVNSSGLCPDFIATAILPNSRLRNAISNLFYQTVICGIICLHW